MSSLIIAPGETLAASGTRDAFGRLSDDLVAEGYPPMQVNFGDREIGKEVKIFTARYRQQASGGGPFGDVRYWDGSAWGYPGGTRWVRVSPDGTVAAPGSSNHGKKRSGDLAAPYNANTAAHRRAQVLARRHNITCEGLQFSSPEWWHWTFWGALGAIGSPSTASSPQRTEENPDMPVFIEPNIINWPNGYTNVYDRNVYLTCQWVANRQITDQWAKDIYVSESWKAARELDRILKEDDKPVQVDRVSQEELAQLVKERLGA